MLQQSRLGHLAYILRFEGIDVPIPSGNIVSQPYPLQLAPFQSSPTVLSVHCKGINHIIVLYKQLYVQKSCPHCRYPSIHHLTHPSQHLNQDPCCSLSQELPTCSQICMLIMVDGRLFSCTCTYTIPQIKKLIPHP
jgi:hypothetical protein